MKIAVDVDGVLLDLMITYCEIYNQKYQTGYEKEDVNRWDFFVEWEISEKKAFEIFHGIYEETSDVPLIDNHAPKVLEKLNKIHHIDIVSARTDKYRSQLKKKLASHGIKKGYHYRNLILVSDKPYNIKLGLNYDLYIDDNPHLAKAIKNKKDIILFLYDQPWNRNIDEEINIIRVRNWQEIQFKITEFMKNK